MIYVDVHKNSQLSFIREEMFPPCIISVLKILQKFFDGSSFDSTTSLFSVYCRSGIEIIIFIHFAPLFSANSISTSPVSVRLEGIHAWLVGFSDILLDRRVDQVSPLGPRPIVIPRGRITEEILQNKPGGRRTRQSCRTQSPPGFP